MLRRTFLASSLAVLPLGSVLRLRGRRKTMADLIDEYESLGHAKVRHKPLFEELCHCLQATGVVWHRGNTYGGIGRCNSIQSGCSVRNCLFVTASPKPILGIPNASDILVPAAIR